MCLIRVSTMVSLSARKTQHETIKKYDIYTYAPHWQAIENWQCKDWYFEIWYVL